MDYSDWLIILSAMILIGFLTLFGLCLLERDLKKNTVLLWVSVAGLILFIIVTGVLIWYYHKKEPKTDQKIKNNGQKKTINGDIIKNTEIDNDRNEMVR